MSVSEPLVSVIIPTYNRPAQLADTLIALANQVFPGEKTEVIVIDDGSSISYGEVTDRSWPFVLRYYWQENRGEVVARNFAVEESRSNFVIFLDDDILVEPEYIEVLYEDHQKYPNDLIIGVLYNKIGKAPTLFQRFLLEDRTPVPSGPVSFVECGSGTLSISKEVYRKVGGMRPLGSGGRNAWGGMDIAYRAYLAGYNTRRCGRAIALHDDYAIRDLMTYGKRMRNVARMAVLHFQRSPELLPLVPMFQDKIPINWKRDPWWLICKKLLRKIISSDQGLSLLNKFIPWHEKAFQSPFLTAPFYRLVIGGCIYQGFQDGLKEFGPIVK